MMAPETQTQPEPAAPLDLRTILLAGLGVTALLTVVLTAFAWPTSDLAPRSLPLTVAAPSSEASDQVQAQLTEALGQDGVEVTAVDDREAAVSAIEDRESYGAVVLGPDGGTEILTATAASPLVAQLLGQAAQEMTGQQMTGQQESAPPTVTDVVSTTDGDPRGAVFGAASLPLALGGLLAGVIASQTSKRVRDRLAAALLASAGAGLALAGVLQGLLDALNGSYWANAGVISLGILAVALPIVGLHRLIGQAGIGIMALLVMLVGNPLSGIASAPELLPLGWLGQLLPPGAAGNALRGTAFFDGAGVGAALIVLLCWAGAGLVLALAPRGRSTTHTEQTNRAAEVAT